MGKVYRSNKIESRRMTHSWHRCSMRPRSINANLVEVDFADEVLGCINLDEGWRDAVLKVLANEGPRPDHSLDMKRI